MRRMLIKELGKVITGNTPSMKNTEFYNSNDIGFVKPDIFENSRITHINSTNSFISEKARNKARIVKKDTVLITCIGSIGKVGIIEGAEYSFNQQINAIEPNDKVVAKYLAYNILSNKNRLMDIANAPVVPIINKTQFENFDIVINENIEEQKRIVKILDQTNRIITLRRNQLNELDRLIKSRFVEMFGDPKENPKRWDEVSVSDILGGKTSNGFFAKRDEYCDDGNVCVLGVADIVNRMYSEINNLPRTSAVNKDIEKYEVKYGDILFCRSSLVAAGIGKASIVPLNTPKNILFECHVIRLQLDLTKCIPEYVQMLTTTDYFRNQVLRHAKTSTMTTIGQDGIVNNLVILPPLIEQQKFFEFIRHVDKLKIVVQQSLDETQMLFDSLMQEYFG